MKYIAIICLIICPYIVSAQQALINIAVGDTIPRIVIDPVNDRSEMSIDVNQLSKQKLVIIDFWATWCGACLKAMPALDSLSQKYTDRLECILVTKEENNTVAQFFKKRVEQDSYVPGMPKVYADTVLHRLFPYYTIPHYVWIKNNRVVAITEKVTEEALVKALAGDDIGLRTKTEMVYDELDKSTKTLFQYLHNDQPPSADLKSYSFWTGYVSKLGPSGGFFPVLSDEGDIVRMTGTNFPLENLYRMALGKGRTFIHDAAVEVRSRSPYFVSRDLSGMAYIDWLEEYGLSYEVVVDAGNDIYKKMHSDLIEAFPEIRAEIVPTQDTCLVLEVFDDNPERKWKVGKDSGFAQVNVNGSQTPDGEIISLMIKFEYMIFYSSKYPIVDHTGYLGKVNIELNGRLNSIDDVNRELRPYGLRIAKKMAAYNKLLIMDK